MPVNVQQGIIKDLSVKILFKKCYLVSIITSLLHANYKENLMTRFLANKKKLILKASLYLIMLPWQRQIRQLNYEKKLTFVLLNC